MLPAGEKTLTSSVHVKGSLTGGGGAGQLLDGWLLANQENIELITATATRWL